MKRMILNFLLTLWQLPQAVVAWTVYFAFMALNDRVKVMNGASIHVVWMPALQKGHIMAFTLWKCVFLFASEEVKEDVLYKVILHEAGHAMQSRYLGWLYLIVIALPSLIVTGVSSSMAEKLYTEKWANKIASTEIDERPKSTETIER